MKLTKLFRDFLTDKVNLMTLVSTCWKIALSPAIIVELKQYRKAHYRV